METQNIYLETLGCFDVRQSGRRIGLARNKDKALLAYLCLNRGRAYTRDYLADLLWQQSDESKGRHSLSQAVYAIRRLLPGLLQIHGSSISCNSNGIGVDVDELIATLSYDDVTGALAYLKGPFLADLEIEDSPGFEEWRSNYNRHFLHRVDHLVKNVFAKLSTDDALKLLLTLPPHVAELLPSIEGLGFLNAKPGYPRPQKEPQPSAISSSNQGSRRQPEVEIVVTPFVGRAQELAALHASWEKAKTGCSQFVLVKGLAGHGKTRLIEEFLSNIDTSNIKLFQSRCYESERRIGFGPIVDSLSKAIHPHDVRGLEDIWLASIGQFLPLLQRESGSPPVLSAAESQNRLFEAILRLLSHISSVTPIVFFLDDIQWADSSSRALMSYLSHRLEKAPVLLLAAHRTKSAGPAVAAPYTEWQQISVSELGDDEVAALVSKVRWQRDSEIPSIQHIRRLTGGHPYLLAELVRCLNSGETADLAKWQQTPVLENVSFFVATLLRSLPSGAQRVVAVLATLGRPAAAELIRKIAKTKRFSACIDLLIARGLATEQGGLIFLRHDLVRETAYRQIPVFTRTELHRRAANVLCKSSKRAGEAAEHYYKGQARSLAYRYALRAIANADARHANDESISCLRLAIKANPRQSDRLRSLIAERLYRAHRLPEARHEVNYLLSRPTQHPQQLIPVRLLDLEIAYHSGSMDRRTLADLLIEIKSNRDTTTLLGRALGLRMRSVYNSGNRQAISECLRELHDFSGNLTTAEGVEALALAARTKSIVDSSVEAERWILPVFAAAQGIPDEELRIKVASYTAAITYEVGKLERSEAMYRDVLRRIDRVGAINSWPLAASHTQMLLIEQGKYNEAIDLAATMRKRARPQDALHAFAVLCGNSVGMFYEMRELDQAKKVVEEAADFMGRVEAKFMELEFCGLKGLVALERGNLTEAAACAETGREMLERVGFRAADVSYIEILISRIDALCNKRDEAVARLRSAIGEYAERDVVCRLRMQLELANQLRRVDTISARLEAKTVFHTASAINARPIAERADSLLHRL